MLDYLCGVHDSWLIRLIADVWCVDEKMGIIFDMPLLALSLTLLSRLGTLEHDKMVFIGSDLIIV